MIATDLAAARRRARSLELDNQRLARRVAELESTLARTSVPAASMAADTPGRRRTSS
jgi:hypothetical protein